MTSARRIPGIETDRADLAARRDLTLVAVVVVGLSRLIEPPGVWLVAVFLLGAVLLGTLQVLSDESAEEDGGLGVPIESFGDSSGALDV